MNLNRKSNRLPILLLLLGLAIAAPLAVAAAPLDNSSAGVPSGTPPGAPPDGAPGAGGPGGSQTVDHGKAAVTLSADTSGKTYNSTGDTENALRVSGKTKVTLTDITVNKSAGAAASGDASNFYGSNAALLAMDGATVTINKAKVTSSAEGANGIYAYGSGTTVTVNGATIRTSSGSSGGVMVTAGGTMYVNNSDIDTKGDHSAALRTDRGGGILTVKGGTYVSHGAGSPAIYSTAAITVSDATLSATGSEAVVVEGKNSVALKNSRVTGNMTSSNSGNQHNVMIYQSMSGDADSGKSSFSMEGGSLTAKIGDMFYVTNTSCVIKLNGVALQLANGTLLKVGGNDARNGWGKAGSNGGQVEFSAGKQVMNGKISVDKISSLKLSLVQGTTFTGSVNAAQEGGTVNLSIDATSTWTLTGDSWLTSLNGSTQQIDTNGFKLYVAGKLAK